MLEGATVERVQWGLIALVGLYLLNATYVHSHPGLRILWVNFFVPGLIAALVVRHRAVTANPEYSTSALWAQMAKAWIVWSVVAYLLMLGAPYTWSRWAHLVLKGSPP